MGGLTALNYLLVHHVYLIFSTASATAYPKKIDLKHRLRSG